MAHGSGKDFRQLLVDLFSEVQESLLEQHEREVGTLRETVGRLTNQLKQFSAADPKGDEASATPLKTKSCSFLDPNQLGSDLNVGAANGKLSQDQLSTLSKNQLSADRAACIKRAGHSKFHSASAQSRQSSGETARQISIESPDGDRDSFLRNDKSFFSDGASDERAKAGSNQLLTPDRCALPVRCRHTAEDREECKKRSVRVMQSLMFNVPVPDVRDSVRESKESIDLVAGDQDANSPVEKSKEDAVIPVDNDAAQTDKPDDAPPPIFNSVHSDLFQGRPVWQLKQETIDRVRRRGSGKRCSGHNIDLAEQQPWIDLKEMMLTNENFSRRRRYALHPQSKVRLFWDLLAIIVLGYDLIFTPLLVYDLPFESYLRTFDVIALVYWTLDIGLSFVTGVYMQAQLHMRLKSIARRYVTTWFALDVFLVIPELMVELAEVYNDDSLDTLALTSWGTRYLRIVRYLRLLRLVKAQKILQDLRSRSNNSFLLLSMSITKLLIFMVLLIHVLACAWFGIGTVSTNGWVYRQGYHEQPVGLQYIYSFQWSMARLHPSNFAANLQLETTHERIFAIFISLVAAAGAGLFVSTITNTMAQLQDLRQQRNRKLHVVRMYIQERHISAHLAMRLKKYIEKALDHKLRAQNRDELEEMLPPALLLDVHFEAWSPILSAHLFLMELCQNHPRIVWSLGRHAMREEPVLARENVFSTGDPCERMLIILIGEFSYEFGANVAAQGNYGFSRQETCYDDPDARPVQVGDTLSEPVLWTPWENRGCLTAMRDGVLLQIKVGPFIEVVCNNEFTLVDVAERSKVIVRWLNEANENFDEVSDILPEKFTEVPQATKPRSKFASLGSRPSLRSVVPEFNEIEFDPNSDTSTGR